MAEEEPLEPELGPAADPAQVKYSAWKERDTKKRQAEDMRSVLGTIQGRRLIWRYLKECRIFEVSFTGNSTTFFNEGMRNIGLKILSDINEADPGAYNKMLSESKENSNAT